ncbi:acylphosphatase [Salinicoccus sesuvii]|uniref:Acylphosphatase n=1 Tax=Salinicoccus sesuvii TaxID=868281 RepID=A0ABV7N987_9STAP
MKEQGREWLPHLSGDIVSEAHGNYLDAYVVALEGWRRGLTLKWHVKESEKFEEMRSWFVDTPGQLFTLSSEHRTHYFFRTRGDKVSNEAVDIGKDKERTKVSLRSKGVVIPEGRKFGRDTSDSTIKKYAEDLQFPLVVKPLDGSFGRGIVSNIENHLELEAALEYVRGKLNFREVIIERYIPGKEYRIYVVDGQVVGAMNRIPANIVTDGMHTIKALIDKKNEIRASNPRLVSCPILVNEEVEAFLGKQGLTLDSIPQPNKTIFLTDKTNISIGGDPIDVLDEISTEIKESAVSALKAVPQLSHGAVDLIVHEDTLQPYIIELNPTANLGGLLYPIKGRARDIPRAIIDHYFPETIDDDRETSTVYFSYDEALIPLKDKTAFRSTLVPFKYEVLHARKHVLTGTVDDFNFHQWIKAQAFEHDLIGRIETKGNGRIEVIVGGNTVYGLDRFAESLSQQESAVDFAVSDEAEYNGTIKIGFEIEGEQRELQAQYKENQGKLAAAERELKKLEKQYNNMLTSRAWKLTSPLRKLTGSVKFLYRNAKR